MTDEHQNTEKDVTDKESEVSPVEQVTLVLDDLRALVRAEVNYYQSRLDYSRHVLRWSFRFGAIAAFAFSGAAIALVIGLVLTLSPLIGPGWATLSVTATFIVIGIICGFKARKWLRKVYFPEIERDDDPIT